MLGGPLEKGRRIHQKSAPRDKKKETPDITARGSFSVLAQGSFIRVLTVQYCARTHIPRIDPATRV